jgi:cell division septation protein DedD
MAPVQNDVVMQNRLGFLSQRCGSVSDTAAAAAASTRVASADTGAAAAAEPAFRVQVAAVGSRKAAEELAARVRSAGLTSVTTQEKGLYKVRAGEFATRAEAQAAAARLKAKLGGSPFVVAGP